MDKPDNEIIEEVEEESAEYNFAELMDALNEHKDLILTIPEDQVTELKEGLQKRKAKVNYAMKKRGIQTAAEMLDFLVYPAKDAKGKDIDGQICVRVKLKARKSIDIIKMEIPDPSI